MTCDWVIACREYRESKDVGPSIVGIIRKLKFKRSELPRSLTVAVACRFSGKPAENAEVTLSVISPSSTVLTTEKAPIGIPVETDFLVGTIDATFTVSAFGRHTVHVMVRGAAETSQNLTYFDLAETTVH